MLTAGARAKTETDAGAAEPAAKSRECGMAERCQSVEDCVCRQCCVSSSLPAALLWLLGQRGQRPVATHLTATGWEQGGK